MSGFPSSSELRPEAPLFVPRTVSQGESRRGPIVSSEQDVDNTGVSEDLDVSSSASGEDHVGMVGGLGEVDSAQESEGSNRSRANEVLDEDPVTVPRRSCRVRRPVMRMNLVHQVTPNDSMGGKQSRADFVQELLHSRLKVAYLLSQNCTPISQYIRFILWATSVKDVWMLSLGIF